MIPSGLLIRLLVWERSWRRVLDPRTVFGYLRLMRAGWRAGESEGDRVQLGGDFIVDGQGMVRLARPSRHVADRPGWQELEDVLGALQEV